ncbi:MAG TPA: hypothetical protein VFW47_17420 [Phenylobacterium sp.]|nr:hypothetical protein [Phenylobacterium sp.]
MSQPPSDSSPQLAAAFIEESLHELAELAARKGYRALAGALALVAREAARAATGPPEPPH